MKKYFFGIIAIVFAFATVAFTTTDKVTTTETWVFDGSLGDQNGDPAVLEDMLDQQYYELAVAPPCGGTSDEICTIEAEEDGFSGKPAIENQPIESDIRDFEQFGSASNVTERL